MRCFDVIGTEKLRTKKTNTYLADHLKIVLRNSQCSGDVFQCSEFLSRDEEWRWRVRDRAPDCIGTRRSKHRRKGNRRHARAAGLPLFQWRKLLRNGGLMVETAPKRERRHENRQHGDQTHTHTSPLERGTPY
jgi:hypothetical protein